MSDLSSLCCRMVLVTLEWADGNAVRHRAKSGDRLVCTGCGKGSIGTDEEVAQATANDKAWDKWSLDEGNQP